MSGLYTVSFTNVAVTAVQDFFELNAHASKQCTILAIGLSQSTELGDAAEEQLSIALKSGQGTSGSGGSAPTPVPMDGVSAASGFTAEANNTTKASAGTPLTHYSWNWNVRGEFEKIFPETMQVKFGAGRRVTLELIAAPADSVTISGYMVVYEEG